MGATSGAAPEDEGIQRLFDSSPDLGGHTSAAAEAAILLGLVAVGSAPFGVMHVITLATGTAALVLALVGVVTTSRPNVSGQALAPLGLMFALVALALIGLRYLGLDTAFGDPYVPTIGGWLEGLNSRFPRP